METFSTLPLDHQILWGIAVFAGVIFILQTLLTIFGVGDSGTDVDHDFSHDGSGDTQNEHGGATQWFSLRNAVAFGLGFSFGTLMFLDQGIMAAIAYFLGLIIGCILVMMNFLMMRLVSKLQSSGNWSLTDTIDKEGKVTIRIPANHEGAGKVSIFVGPAVREIEAVTTGETIPHGRTVRVTATSGDRLVVIPLS